jgi:hypothetical protein
MPTEFKERAKVLKDYRKMEAPNYIYAGVTFINPDILKQANAPPDCL